MANSYWMVSEFFHFDGLIITGTITYKHIAMIPFLLGILFLLYYYAWHKLRHKNEDSTM
jgi:hypothetical protein